MSTPDSILGAMARRTQAIAQPRADAYADSNRLYLVTIIRPVLEPSFNRQTGAMTHPAGEPVYAGQARIYAITPGQQIDLGAGPQYYGNVRVTIPAEELIPPRIDDVITIVDDGLGFARTMGTAERQFRVTGVTSGGQLMTGWVLDASGIEPQRQLDD